MSILSSGASGVPEMPCCADLPNSSGLLVPVQDPTAPDGSDRSGSYRHLSTRDKKWGGVGDSSGWPDYRTHLFFSVCVCGGGGGGGGGGG